MTNSANGPARAGAVMVVGFAVVLLAGLTSVASPPPVNAQSEPAATVFAIRRPPPAPVVVYPAADLNGAPPVHPALVVATPTLPVDSTLSTVEEASPDNGGSLTANLGGSDSAASSVGGSHETDGSKRRSNK